MAVTQAERKTKRKLPKDQLSRDDQAVLSLVDKMKLKSLRKSLKHQLNRFNKELIQIMRNSGMSGMDMVRASGIDQAAISGILNGKRKRIPVVMAANIARAVGVSPEQFGQMLYGCAGK